ncbi:pyridoxal phosphate-dependent aminotransferase [Bartonella apis]|uniref:pyridoxal phosphate-dependent aminotransferase n=1 Tax=Bartonella apis TaxID=1686310 RepID=UPI00242ADD77|nr:aminotransferase class I/II-fold pyridoxal phosphate-dependent enzyme [Bartonella apis]MCT6823502.1 aminotransferase class I/II-fold pyridoxal phosphate-dependent enzyme [Bartonella apis]MCT6859988.1 aminotransferase class I/II-fold pyridoxal phosphate-dependent enzyme [Bartonella apis]MCT6887686.1 aminotransferase class I/II-fold pyridoxal phosphate-dependent enzyme [Bartonella apis]
MICLSRRSNVDPFFAMDVLAAANKKMKAGEPVISMAIGQPAAPCPALVLEAAGRALKDGHIGYTDSLGLTALREKIAAYYEEHHKLSVSPERVAVTTGSSAAFNLAFLAFFDVGDRVAITRPGYPAYRHIMKALGLEVVEIDTGGSGLPDLKMLEETQSHSPLKGILFASPSNPTGASLKPEELKNIIEFCHEHNITVIADEIYHRLNFSAPDVTALSFSDDVTVINSFSKYYCMTGWRVGWMVLPENAVRSVERISQNLYISAPELSQIAAISAFDATSELEKIKDSYRINREHLTKTLPALGLKLLAPMDGAFYAYCDISKFSNDSTEFARKMLEETNVAATPGIDFDTLEGKRTMRFSYAGAPKAIDEALVRLDKWLH